MNKKCAYDKINEMRDRAFENSEKDKVLKKSNCKSMIGTILFFVFVALFIILVIIYLLMEV